ncbi:Arc family DNA-binding protein [Mesorhizobium sp. IMUNJ 23232]|uniref:Arc family DNA-binding protein n=1 Tax=Mesorhizobium sp. IMUNJ 23232 TaxID=3376064 RepID=UPI00379B81F8
MKPGMEHEKRKREGQQLLLRFPNGSDMRDRLNEIARGNGRSLSAEIFHRLEWSLEAEAKGEFASGSNTGLQWKTEQLEATVRLLVDAQNQLRTDINALKDKIEGISRC